MSAVTSPENNGKMEYNPLQSAWYKRYERTLDIVTIVSFIITIIGVAIIQEFQSASSGALGHTKKVLAFTPLTIGMMGFFLVTLEKMKKLMIVDAMEKISKQKSNNSGA